MPGFCVIENAELDTDVTPTLVPWPTAKFGMPEEEYAPEKVGIVGNPVNVGLKPVVLEELPALGLMHTVWHTPFPGTT